MSGVISAGGAGNKPGKRRRKPKKSKNAKPVADLLTSPSDDNRREGDLTSVSIDSPPLASNVNTPPSPSELPLRERLNMMKQPDIEVSHDHSLFGEVTSSDPFAPSGGEGDAASSFDRFVSLPPPPPLSSPKNSRLSSSTSPVAMAEVSNRDDPMVSEQQQAHTQHGSGSVCHMCKCQLTPPPPPAVIPLAPPHLLHGNNVFLHGLRAAPRVRDEQW